MISAQVSGLRPVRQKDYQALRLSNPVHHPGGQQCPQAAMAPSETGFQADRINQPPRVHEAGQGYPSEAKSRSGHLDNFTLFDMIFNDLGKDIVSFLFLRTLQDFNKP